MVPKGLAHVLLDSCAPPHKSVSRNINFLALIAVFLAVLARAPRLSGHHVKFLCDNTSTVSSINKNSSKNVCIVKWLKLIICESLRCWFSLTESHCPGKTDIVADAFIGLPKVKLSLKNLFLNIVSSQQIVYRQELFADVHVQKL